MLIMMYAQLAELLASGIFFTSGDVSSPVEK